MFGISGTELIIVLVFGFLLFGPDKLPQMGRTIGRALRQFRETQEKLTAVVQTEVVDPMAAAAQAKTKKDGAASSADDSDAPSSVEGAPVSNPTAGPARKETFAERRARLAAEKAQAEAAKNAADGEQDDADATVSAGDASASGQDAAPEAPAQPAAEEEPAVRTTEDLYARRPRKRKQAEDTAAADSSANDDISAAPADAPATEGGEQ